MNDTTVIGASSAPAEDVRDYVGAVRAWLGDLPREEVDDLTAGMEADLAERAAETGARLGDLLGQPEEYAAELRAAAGLPARSAAPATRQPGSGAVAEVARAFRDAGDGALERWPWLRELQPVWWVARGVALGGALAAMTDAGRLVFPALGAALSFWLGRTLAARREGRRASSWLVLLNVAAALAVVPVTAWLVAPPTVYVDDDPGLRQGLFLDGGQVGNLYVYDAAGNRVEGARVFDQEGRPVRLDPSVTVLSDDGREDGTTWPPDPSASAVFPIAVPGSDPWAGPGQGMEDGGWVPPTTITPLLIQPSAVPTPSPSPSTSATPAPGSSAGPSGSPSPSPSVTPTPSGSATP